MDRLKKAIKKASFVSFSWHDVGITALFLFISLCICFFIRYFDDGNIYVSMIFMLDVFLTARFTKGYLYGIWASVIGVLGINYFFTYPFFAFNFSMAGYPLSIASMLIVAVITSAMTSRVKQQEQIQAAAEKEKMRGNLLRAISHDLRTPLTSIAGLTGVLSDNDEKMTSAERKEIYKEITDDATWLIRMVENLLSVTKIRIDSENLRKVPELAEEIVASAVQKLKKYYPDVRITVSAPEEVLFVPMDCVLIEQVLINLMENSIRHSGGATEIKVQVSTDGEFAKFTVSDNGKGFDRAILKKIRAEDFVMPSMREGDNSKNMGIGLSVCTTIIKAHGGKIVAENENGAKICFYLPVEKEEKYE